MKVIVTGSRDWPDDIAVWSALFSSFKESEEKGEPLHVVHGGCPTGADAFAADWCRRAREFGFNVFEIVFEADWSIGRKAGPERNKRMIKAGADKVLAFNRNDSRGTTGTMKLAAAHGIPIEPCIIRDKGVSK